MEQFKETAIRLCAACGESVGSLNRAAERARRDYQGARRETELQAIEKSRGATQQKYAQLLAEAEDAAKVRIQGETISGQDLTADFALLDADRVWLTQEEFDAIAARNASNRAMNAALRTYAQRQKLCYSAAEGIADRTAAVENIAAAAASVIFAGGGALDAELAAKSGAVRVI